METNILGICNKLTSPSDFKFPFPPYDIQLDFMKNLYNAIEEKKIGIFESPTGTGKSLSLICGALTWLRDHEEREIRNLEVAQKNGEPNGESSGDWLSAQIKARALDATVQQVKRQLQRIQIRSNNIKTIRQRVEENKKIPNLSNVNQKTQNMMEDVDSKTLDEVDDILEEFSDHLEEAKDTGKDEISPEEEELPITRIIYCSRTHSQLSQFVSELNKTNFSHDTRLVHLASRQNYCINKKFQDITNVATLNEKCLELQVGKEYNTTLRDEEGVSLKKQKSGEATKCPHMKGVSEFSDIIISKVMDVETVSQASKRSGSCPYYATRKSIPLAQILVLPYHTLLHKDSRSASGISIDNSVIIIDEAHNLLETISHIHSCQITGQHLVLAHSQLSQYKDKYANRFSAVNLLYLNQIIFVISALMKLIRPNLNSDSNEIKGQESNTQMFKVSDFVTTAEIDNYNLYKLLAFCKQTKICHKLQRFSYKSAPFVKVDQAPKICASAGIKQFIQGIKQKKSSKKYKRGDSDLSVEEQLNNELQLQLEEHTSQPLFQITAFLACLTQEYNDGRIVVTRGATIGKATIKYLLLEPATAVIDIITKARSVILAGGTMEPVAEFKERLFGVCGVSSNRIIHFSCGHVIPKENILPIVVCTGPTGKQLDFSFHSRSSAVMMNEIGRLLINVSNVVPSGIVCFFPSYEYEKEVYEYLEKNGIIKNIAVKKKVFREPKKASEVDRILLDYAAVIEKSKGNPQLNGAILFSVVGGKLSEGLNFSDDLGRCVIVIGMPYPNMKSPELQEKIKFLEEHCGPNAGKIHYENLCMKAVNQSIGRSIRHRNDYSSVLLVDHRYSHSQVSKLLPKWMQDSLRIEREKFGPVLATLCKFFKIHRENSK